LEYILVIDTQANDNQTQTEQSEQPPQVNHADDKAPANETISQAAARLAAEVVASPIFYLVAGMHSCNCLYPAALFKITP
jgi:hypothetical protein